MDCFKYLGSQVAADGECERDVNLSLRSLVGVSRKDRVRNEEVSRRAGIERELPRRADLRVLRWFGHVERMDEYRMARRLLMAEVREDG